MSSVRSTILRAILAIGLAFALWAFVSFSQNPEELVSFPDVPLQVVGLSSGLAIVDQNGLPSVALPSVDIQLRTDRAQQSVLRPVDVRAVLDLTGFGPGEHTVPVNVQPTRSNLSFNVPDDGVEPASVVVRLDEVVSREVPINLQITGNLPFSFERGDPQISSAGNPIARVLISGPQSRVERVSEAQGVVSIDQIRANYDAPVSLSVVDEAGRTVEGVQMDPGQVRVLIPIRSVVGLKLVPVQPQITGQPGAGYEVTAVEIEPPLIALTGASGPLDAANVIGTEPIPIDGIVRTLARDVRLIFPSGTSPNEGEPTIVRVRVRLAPLSRPFQVQLPAQVTLTGVGNLLVNANPAVVTVSLSGSSEALESLAATTVRASVDVTNLGPGTYSLQAVVPLPAGVTLVGDPPIVTVTVRNPPAALPTNTPNPVNPGPSPPGPSPTPGESVEPTAAPTGEPTAAPTGEPTAAPTGEPTAAPTAAPSVAPTP